MSTTPGELAQRVVEHIAQGQFELVEAQLAQHLRPMLPAAQLQATWQSIQQQAGDFQQQLTVHTVQTPQAAVEVVTCAFANTQLDINMAFNAAEEIISLAVTPVGAVEQQATLQYDAPSYARPEAFQEQEVQVGTGEWALPGTLSLPVGTGPFPAVVLIHGSGSTDRDETIPPNKPFRDLAWGLASQGIAVLRYDKRTRVYGPKIVALSTITVMQETIEDALLALEVLRQRPEIDSQQLYLLGHSLGGYLMPRILSMPAAANIQGAILLAASARPLEDLLLDQISYINSLQDNGEAGQQQLEVLKQQTARVKDPQLSLETPTSSLPFNTPPSYWLDLRGYQPAELARQQSQPLLILQADSDYQVTQDDFQLWHNALQDHGNVTFKRYPGLYHLFMPSNSEPGHKATPDSYKVPGHISTEVINDIASWITQPQSPS